MAATDGLQDGEFIQVACVSQWPSIMGDVVWTGGTGWAVTLEGRGTGRDSPEGVVKFLGDFKRFMGDKVAQGRCG